MILFLRGHDFHYETENLCRVFFPYEKIKTVREEPETEPGERYVRALLEQRADGYCYSVEYQFGNFHLEKCDFSGFEPEKERERRLSVVLFGVLQEVTGITPAWGILTGIHPVKLFRTLCEEHSLCAAENWFKNKLLVSDEKIRLAKQISENQHAVLRNNGENSFSLYVSIPFCPSRCSYCSFVSQTVERSRRLIPDYMEKLLEEIAYTAEIARACALRLESVYIGGGTPTILEPEQLTAVLEKIRGSFDMSLCREFTVEGGRPDTITEAKLDAIGGCGVRRISINPQTMQDRVLKAIGRRHSAAQTVEAFRLARKKYMFDINMDLIIGLPEDTPDLFRDTLEKIIRLDPENITVHALALKHAAQMMQEDKTFHGDRLRAEIMGQTAQEMLTQAGYLPYYLYRQSRMAGNLENVGWTKPGKQCFYNIYTMEECHTILACGAGGVSKIKSPYSDRLERIFNFKYSYEYVTRFHELLQRKDRVTTLYEEFRREKNLQGVYPV